MAWNAPSPIGFIGAGRGGDCPHAGWELPCARAGLAGPVCPPFVRPSVRSSSSRRGQRAPEYLKTIRFIDDSAEVKSYNETKIDAQKNVCRSTGWRKVSGCFAWEFWECWKGNALLRNAKTTNPPLCAISSTKRYFFCFETLNNFQVGRKCKKVIEFYIPQWTKLLPFHGVQNGICANSFQRAWSDFAIFEQKPVLAPEMHNSAQKWKARKWSSEDKE